MDLFGYKIPNYREEDTFTFQSPAVIPTVIAVFGSIWLINSTPSYKPKFTDISIARRYEELLNDIQQNPKRIKNIRLLTTNFNQLIEPFNWQKTDSNGQVISVPDYTLNQLSPDQYQTKVLDIPYNCLILDSNTFFYYLYHPNTILTMTIRYDNGNLADLLN